MPALNEKAHGASSRSVFLEHDVSDCHRADLFAQNRLLKEEIRRVLEEIDSNALRHSKGRPRTILSSKGSKSSRIVLDPRVELETVTNKISKLRAEYEKCHQHSSYRLIGDQISSTKLKLSQVRSEIEVLRKEAAQQQRVLAGNKTHMMIRSLEEEIAFEKQLHGELRRDAKELDQMVRGKQEEYESWKESPGCTSEIQLFESEIAELREEIYGMQKELCDISC